MTDWAEWSRAATQLMQQRNDAWQARFHIGSAPFHWDLNAGTIAFQRETDEVVADICVVGTLAGGTFLWAWANADLPPGAKHRLDAVREFGQRHDLSLLTEAQWPSGRSEALEMLAVAGRVQDAEGVFIDVAGDATLFFTLVNFRSRPPRHAV